MIRIFSLFLVLTLAFSTLFTFAKADDTAPFDLYAKAYAVIEAETKAVICSDNAEEKLPMASTTKIMTCILACESGLLDEKVTVKAENVMVEGSSLGLCGGDKLTLRDILRGLMMVSGNDAALVTADFVGGSVENFVDMMNAKAEELGLDNTHFVNPHGLYDDDHYTTARELAELAAYSLNNKDFKDIVSTVTAKLHYFESEIGEYDRTLTNKNTLLTSLDGCVGVKTGYVKKSGRCLVTAAEREGKQVVSVVLNCADSWEESRKLIEYGMENVTYADIVSDVVEYDLNVVGSETRTVSVQSYQFMSSSMRTVDADSVEIVEVIPRFVYAPVNAGDEVGEIRVYIGGNLCREIPVLATESAEALPKGKAILENLGQMLISNLEWIYK